MNGLASVFDSKIFQQTASKTYHPLCHIHSISLGKDLYLDLKGLSFISEVQVFTSHFPEVTCPMSFEQKMCEN